MDQDHFRINVARYAGKGYAGAPRYTHLFATEIPGPTEDKAVEVFKELEQRFPAPEFEVTVTEWRYRGFTRDWHNGEV